MSEIDKKNKRIDLILDEIFNSKSRYITTLPSTEDYSSGKHEDLRFGEILLEKNLIMPSFPPFKLSDWGLDICENHGGWLKYLNYKTNSEFTEKNEIEENNQLKKEILHLQKQNLTLSNRKLKRDLIVWLIGILIGAIITNWKTILILLELLPPE